MVSLCNHQPSCMASPQSPIMASLLFSFFFLLAALSSAIDMSILNCEHGLQKRTEAEVLAMFEAWMVRQRKLYTSLPERERRFEIFKDNLKYIDERNAMNLTYKLGLTKFVDLTNEEYRSMYTSRVDASWQSLYGRRTSDRYAYQVGEYLPESVDWREQGAVLPQVKNQGRCESCWSFTTVAAVEGMHAIATGDLISLSEQELVDCVTGNDGCKGGRLHTAFEYIIQNGGIDTENNYPFMGVQDQCKSNRAKIVSIDGYHLVPRNNEIALQNAVANQPVAVAIEASSDDFQLYTNGVFTGQCGINVDHGVVIVGYGSENGVDYWIVRNSYGPNWGENGYMRIERNVRSRFGKCGLATWPYYPTKNGNGIHNSEKKVWSA